MYDEEPETDDDMKHGLVDSSDDEAENRKASWDSETEIEGSKFPEYSDGTEEVVAAIPPPQARKEGRQKKESRVKPKHKVRFAPEKCRRKDCGCAGQAEQPKTRTPSVTSSAPIELGCAPQTVDPSVSTMGRAPGTDEIARANYMIEDAERQGSNSKPVDLFELGGERSLNEIEQQEWVPLPRPLVIDSGAGETVIPRQWFSAHPLEPSAGSLAQDFYTTADGTKVYNEGQRQLLMCTPDGRSTRKMTFQVAKVNKALGSVSQMVDSQHRVIFDSDDYGRDISYIENKKSGEKMWLRRENGVYVLDMLVAPPSLNKEPPGDQGFGRQGAR